ncbi:MAG: 3-phosphoshikimate 1-carboxyvinyltransferase [Bacteroidales bacterium]|nr:3-phosphoshikimate 1-carboxyvinyltransferase [Bacteroidales bacterium]
MTQRSLMSTSTIQLPASKSISNRVLMIRALTATPAEVSNLSECEDTQVLQKALSSNDKEIDLKASGTALRFLTAYYAVTPGIHRLTGCQRLMERPMVPLIDALRQLGASIDFTTCGEPRGIVIRGSHLMGGQVVMRGDVSSQFVSAMLLIGPILPLGLQIDLVGRVVSRPYIELTLHLMRTFGADARFASTNRLLVSPGKYQARSYTVEADWSAASYWYAMMGLNKRFHFCFPDLTPDSLQGDRIVVELMRHKGDVLAHEFTDTPDIVPTMAVYCVLKGIHFEFSGLQGLRLKETDRLTALRTELTKWGYRVSATDSTLCWHGERCEGSDEPIETYGDHRMAMSFAIGAVAGKPVRIAHPEVVNKSYPHFWDNLRTIGFDVTNINNFELRLFAS